MEQKFASRDGGGEEGSSEPAPERRGKDGSESSDSSEEDAVGDGDLSGELLDACCEADLHKVRYLVEERHVDPQSCRETVFQFIALHLASEYGHLPIVQYLLERGCDPMCRGMKSNTPLHHACQEGELDVVRYLVEEVKVDPSCPDENDSTPLHAAAQCGTLARVSYRIFCWGGEK